MNIPLHEMIVSQVEKVTALLRERGMKMGAAESCTGGLIGGYMTTPAGSSQVFNGSVVSYSNEAKHNILKVPPRVILDKGAVSEECAEAMARGAFKVLNVDIAVSVTGIAGPGGATPGKPVGLVWMGVAFRANPAAMLVESQFICWPGEREEVRLMTCLAALKLVESTLLRLPTIADRDLVRGALAS